MLEITLENEQLNVINDLVANATKYLEETSINDGSSQGKISAVDQLLKLVESNGTTFFHSEVKEFYASIPVENPTNHVEIQPVATLTLEFMKDKTDWHGTHSALHDKFVETAENCAVNTKDKSFPKDATALGKRLRNIMSNLHHEVFIRHTKGRATTYPLTLEKRNKPTSPFENGWVEVPDAEVPPEFLNPMPHEKSHEQITL